jgi:hypothetical protein
LRALASTTRRASSCARRRLLGALDTTPGGPNASLLDYVRRLAADTARAARDDAAYKGPLKALPESAVASCPGGRR